MTEAAISIKPRDLEATPGHPVPPVGSAAAQRNESWNLAVLALHFVLFRISWIFKTESVIIPAFVDVISGAGWLRGCLPAVNRFGNSVPPLFYADHLLHTRRKKWSLLTSGLAMAVPFAILSGLWSVLDDKKQPWLPPLFLLLYFVFSSCNGLDQLSLGTLQGKLIRPARHGRLLAISGMFGSLMAILAAWLLLGRWLALPDGGFEYIFGFTAAGFAVAATLSLALAEPPDQPFTVPRERHRFRSAWNIVRTDKAFRRFAAVAMLFATAQLLFPHYQALGLQQTASSSQDLMVWVIVQNAGVGLFSTVMGRIADRVGNRLAVRIETLLTAATPILAMAVAWQTHGHRVYWVTFGLLGIVPVTFRTLINYTLELTDPPDHPRYLSTLTLCMVVPSLLSPFVGGLVDILGFEPIFVTIAALNAAGCALTFGIAEPRERRRAKLTT